MSRPFPPLNPLRAFEVAARHLSFTRAAEELSVTPSAVSHQIKTLEENLGITLFTRDANTLSLTAAGKAYLPSVQQAFKQLAHATQQLRTLNLQALKINVPPTFAVKWLMPRMAGFMREYPEIDLKVSTLNHLIDFSREDFDLCIRYGRGVYPGLLAELCMPVEVFPVCSPKLLHGANPLINPSDLKFHTLIHDESFYSDVSNPTWGNWLENMGISDVDSMRGPSFWPSHLVIEAAKDGLGVALVKKNWILKDIADGTLVRPFSSSLPVEFSYFIVYPAERTQDTRIRTFINWMQKELELERASTMAAWLSSDPT